MQDRYTGQAGSFINDPEAGIRIPAEDWDVYQADKAAYLNNQDAAIAAFKAPIKKAAKKTTEESN